MITLIILTVLTILGIYLISTESRYNEFWREVIGLCMSLVFGIWLIIHVLCISTVSYHYEMFVVKRNSFENTLNNARENGNKYETAAIVKDVAEWNTRLAEYKYDNKTFWFNQFIDDRVENLKPIK